MNGNAYEVRSEEGVRSARGSVRDILAALRNLENLLRSTKVGPRALSQIVHELRPSCQPLGEVFSALIDNVALQAQGPDLMRSMSAFARDRAVRLDDALVKASGSDMGARARLGLEGAVRQLGADLGALRELIELLHASTRSAPTDLDVNTLVAHVLALRVPTDLRRGEFIQVAFVRGLRCDSLAVDPRVILPLVAISLGLASRSGKRLELSATSSAGETTIVFRRTVASPKDALLYFPPRVIDHTLEVATLAAQTVGFTLTADDPAGEVRLLIPSSPASPKSLVPPALRGTPNA